MHLTGVDLSNFHARNLDKLNEYLALKGIDSDNEAAVIDALQRLDLTREDCGLDNVEQDVDG